MGKKHLGLALSILLPLPGAVTAALYDRGGGLIYDDVLNVTWLQDANYALTEFSGNTGRVQSIMDNVGVVADSVGVHTLVSADFEASTGRMNWYGASAWAKDLEYFDAVRGVTWSDWRLPAVSPINGTDFNLGDAVFVPPDSISSTPVYDGSTDEAWNIGAPGTVYAGSTASEMAYMWLRNLLGNVSQYDLNGNLNPNWTSSVSADFVDAETSQIKSFQNLQPLYWSGAEVGPFPDYAFFFGMDNGAQGAFDIGKQYWLPQGPYAWAVRDGDVNAVPIPATAWMFASALGVFGYLGKRRPST